MPTIYIDNQPYKVKDGQNLLHTALSLGFNLPYFCWHPALGSVGACRQCAVKQFRDEKDERGRIVMACMTPAANNTRISIADAEAKAFREGVIEWLMTNHPHDCPICDEGGECHLQDMTVMTGHAYRRYRFKKRTYRNQYLGPFVNHEMNRCIQCYRCVRFYRDYAGGHDLNAFASRNHVYFGRFEEGVLESEFSGNLVEICPTGVFTDKTLKAHYARKWDLQTAPSICVHCGLGCNTIAGERYGQLRRILNRYNSEVNGYFLCDRGRFGYEFVNSDRRTHHPLLRGAQDSLKPLSAEDALQYLADLLSNTDRVIGIGSPRASLEANFALRALVGSDRFYNGMSAKDSHLISTALKILQEGPARSPSLHDTQLADAVFVLGEDLTNTAPMLDLAIRQSVRWQPMKRAEALKIPIWDDAAVREVIQDEKGALFIATPNRTKLDEIATQTYRAAPDDLARLGFAVAHVLGADVPAVTGLAGEVRELANRIAQALKEAQRPLIVSGTSCGNEAVMQAAANVAWALCGEERVAALCFTVPECNSMGVGLMSNNDLDAAFKGIQDGKADTALILENDLYRRSDAATVNIFLDAVAHVIVIDHLIHATAEKAEVVFPAGTFAESDGTFVSNEGRAQRFFQVFVPTGDIQESWRWVRDLMIASGRPEAEAWQSLDDITIALSREASIFKPMMEITPPAEFRIVGQKIPRQSLRYSGRTAMLANIDVHEPKPPDDPDSPLAFSMEGYAGKPPSALISRFWAPSWNSVQALNKFQSEVGGPLHDGDPGRRLIEPTENRERSYFGGVPDPFEPRKGEWLVVPLYQIFGSDELSVLTPGVAERAPHLYLALNPDDAASLRANEGNDVELFLTHVSQRLPVKLAPGMPKGIAGLPVGLPGTQRLDLPAWGKVTR